MFVTLNQIVVSGQQKYSYKNKNVKKKKRKKKTQADMATSSVATKNSKPESIILALVISNSFYK